MGGNPARIYVAGMGHYETDEGASQSGWRYLIEVLGDLTLQGFRMTRIPAAGDCRFTDSLLIHDRPSIQSGVGP